MVTKRSVGWAVLVAAALAGGSAAAGDLGTLVSDGKAALDLRYRLEAVDQDGLPEDALSNTLRLRLRLETGTVSGWSALVEFDHVEAIGPEDYNSTRNGRVQYPVVADPEGTDLNQAYLKYGGFGGTVLKLGRQRLTLDNQRFIGAVGWRQNEQTYDSFTLANTSLADTTLTYGYLDRVNRVFGPEDGTPPATLDLAGHVAHLKYAGFGFGTVGLYDYYLDFDDAATLSTNTLGARFDGAFPMGDVKATLRAEYARQVDVGDNPLDIDADYWVVEAGVAGKALGAAVGYEVLGGENGPGPNRAFQTPLATLHAFNGWADKFLTTPAGGLEDLYVTLTAEWKGLKGKLTWHDFGAEAGGGSYGTELDASVGYQFAGRYDLLVKYAGYSADGLFTDTRKFWVQFAAGF